MIVLVQGASSAQGQVTCPDGTQPQTCNANATTFGTLCLERCPPGTTTLMGNQCQLPEGVNPEICTSVGLPVTGSVCYTHWVSACPTGHGCLKVLTMPLPPCAAGDEPLGNLCMQPCPPGSTLIDPETCSCTAPGGIPNTDYCSRPFYSRCNDGYDVVSGQCQLYAGCSFGIFRYSCTDPSVCVDYPGASICNLALADIAADGPSHRPCPAVS